MKKLMFMQLRDKNGKPFDFEFYGNPRDIDHLRERGFEVFKIKNQYPIWVAEYRLVGVWCFFQDIINFKNPL